MKNYCIIWITLFSQHFPHCYWIEIIIRFPIGFANEKNPSDKHFVYTHSLPWFELRTLVWMNHLYIIWQTNLLIEDKYEWWVAIKWEQNVHVPVIAVGRSTGKGWLKLIRLRKGIHIMPHHPMCKAGVSFKFSTAY